MSAATMTKINHPDASLISICHSFAYEELTRWWRYVTAPAGLAEAQDTPTDWDTLRLIEATPATTLEGLRAKGLASVAFNRDTASDSTHLVSTLLRDLAEPEFGQMLARLKSEYGPLPPVYRCEGGLLA